MLFCWKGSFPVIEAVMFLVNESVKSLNSYELAQAVKLIILHGCTNCLNLEMEPKHLAKSDI